MAQAYHDPLTDLPNRTLLMDRLAHALTVAARLTACVRNSDTVARLGGDEFVVLMENLSGVGECAVLAGKLLAALSWELEAGGIRVGASIGIAVYPADGRSAAALLQQADAALYAVKAAGKGGFRFPSSRMGV